MYYVGCMMCENWVLYYELFNFSSKTIIVQILYP
jgi:hypothetical protein